MEQNASTPNAPTPASFTPLDKPGSLSSKMLTGLIGLVIGLALGYLGVKMLGGSTKPSALPATSSSAITVPADAVQIEACSNQEGTLFVEPQNIPVGPVYMVNNNKVIGVEYMLDKNQLTNGKTFSNLVGLGIKVDHVNIRLAPNGHAGMAMPHYMVDVYSVSPQAEQTINCSNSISNEATPSGSIMSPTASSSAEEMMK